MTAMTGAERQRRWRERNGANVGGRPGPPPSAPCGTVSAYKRHQRNKEHIDAECRDAYNAARRWKRRLATRPDWLGGPA